MLGGASLCESLETPGGASPVMGVSGVATTGRMWAESQKIPVSSGGLEPLTWRKITEMSTAQPGADAPHYALQDMYRN
jgi:hypothetical protein